MSDNAEIRFEGIGVSPGIAFGRIHVVREDLDEVVRYQIAPSQVTDEIGRFEAGLIQTRMQILEMQQRIAESIGAKDAANARLFMIPGMGHCTGGDGPFVFDPVATLDNWVATARAPDRIIVRNPPNAAARTRPICPFPQEAVYSGTGSTDDEKNFRCAAPAR